MKSLIILCSFLVLGAFAATIPTTEPLPVSLVSEATTPEVITINPATGATSEAPTIGPATESTQTAMTINPEPGSTQTVITINPGPGSTQTAMTINPGSSSKPITTTAAPQPTPAPSKSKFDGGSFGGGIALGIGLMVLAVIAYTCYSRRGTRGYDTM